MFQANASGDLVDNRLDYRDGNRDAGRQRKILQNERRLAEKISGLLVVGKNLLIIAQRRRRRNHDAGRAIVHYHIGQRPHLGKTRSRDTRDHRHSPVDPLQDATNISFAILRS